VGVKARLAVLLAILCFSAFAAADEWKKDFKTGTSPQLRVTVDDASVEVRTGAGDAISARVTTQGYKIGPGEVTVTERQNGDEVTLTVKVPHYRINFGVNRNVKVEITAPPNTNTSISSGDGSLAASGLHGPTELRTGDGSIVVNGHDGALRAHTGDGSVRASGRFDRLEVETSDGSIHVDAQQGSRVAGDWRLRTGDGSVHFSLPADLSASLDVSTGDGRIQYSGLNLSSSSKNEHSLRGTLNNGGPRLEIHTGDGSVSLSKN
jgi:hypothetical protein